MERKRKKILKRHISMINRDVTVTEELLDKLYMKNILTKNEVDKLRKSMEMNAHCPTEDLMHIINKKDPKLCDEFISVLGNEYEWLYEFLVNESRVMEDCDSDEDDEEEEVDGIVSVLRHLEIPKFPPYFIPRTSKLEELRRHLLKLRTKGTMILHGMTLIGKSCLVASALRDKQLLQNFDNHIFWINLGEIHNITTDREKIIQEMYRILIRISNENVDLTNVPEDLKIERLKIALANLFFKNDLHNSLLILDKVRVKGVVEMFDFGCKRVVTTCDLNLIEKIDKIKILKLTDGFTRDETLALFGKCLNTTIRGSIGCEATMIHNMCRGYPMLIALIGSLLEDSPNEALYNPRFWSYIIEKLKNFDEISDDFDNKLCNALNLCIENLSKDHRNYFEALAIFVEDANITPRTLQLLWNVNEFNVRQIMVHLEKKSLVLSTYKYELRSYVYGIHHLLISKLRKTVVDLKGIHKRLIEAFMADCKGSFEDFTGDNYVLQYYGYHLEKAEMFDEFRVYFDFDFIDAKVRHVGSTDLLRDMVVYRKYITGNDKTLERQLQEYEKFISEYGYILCKYPDVDIVQCGLQQPTESFVHMAALQVVKQNPNKIYFKLQLSRERHYFTHLLELDYNITAACFTDDTNQVLLGAETGTIYMWEHHYQTEICTFSGHTRKIKKLLMSPDKKCFLSVSEDGSVKLWPLPHSHAKNKSITDGQLPSPSLKQRVHHKFFPEEEDLTAKTTYRAAQPDDRLISAAFCNRYEHVKLVVTGSEQGEVVVWNVLGDCIVVRIARRGYPARCVAFSADDSVLVFTCEKNILLYSFKSGEYLSQFCNASDVVSMIFVVPSLSTVNELVSVSGSRLSLWKWRNDEDVRVVEILSHKELNRSNCRKTFTCGAVTKDGKYLVTGSTDLYLRTYDLKLNNAESITVEKYNEKEVVCLDTFFKDCDESQVHILLVGSENKTVKQWYVYGDAKETCVKSLPIFATFWGCGSVPRIAIPNTNKQVQILNGYKILMETEEMEEQIACVCFSMSGDRIAFGLVDGKVYEYDYKTRSLMIVFVLDGCVNFLKYYENLENEKSTPDGGILIAGSKNGNLMLYKNHKRINLQRPKNHLKFHQTIHCHQLKTTNQFLSISSNRIVTIYSSDGFAKILIGDKSNVSVVQCAVSADDSRLVMVMSDGCFEVYDLVAVDGGVELELVQTKRLDGKLTACGISYDGGVVAVGKEDGCISIWNVETRRMLTHLVLHQTPVRCLHFSPKPALILVSLGDQIAWWDISKVSKQEHKKKMEIDFKSLSLCEEFPAFLWSEKEGHRKNPCLLSAIKLRGTHATSLSVSTTFRSFITVDNTGKVYIIELL